MLKKLKKALKALLGVDEQHKVVVKIEPKSEEKKKNRPAKDASPRREREKSKERSRGEKSKNSAERSAVSEKPKRERSSKRPRAERPVQVETPETPKAPRPERPAALKEVPAAEGKVRFLDLPLHEDVQFGVQHAGFEYCTPIQAMALPALLEAAAGADSRADPGTGDADSQGCRGARDFHGIEQCGGVRRNGSREAAPFTRESGRSADRNAGAGDRLFAQRRPRFE